MRNDNEHIKVEHCKKYPKMKGKQDERLRVYLKLV
jgi:hypothetical protein